MWTKLKREIQGNSARALALGGVLAVASGCSLNPHADEVTIQIAVGDGSASFATLGSQSSGTISTLSTTDPHTPPSSVDGFECFLVNVTGPGIPHFGMGGGYYYDQSSCPQEGVHSKFFTANTDVIELKVPSGKDRLVQVIGVKVAGGGCPTNVSFQDLRGFNSDGTPKYEHRLYLLGETKTHLVADTTVTVKNSYVASTDWSVTDPFYCDYYGTPGEATVADPTTVSGLGLWLAPEKIGGYTSGSSIGTWNDLSALANDASSASGPSAADHTTPSGGVFKMAYYPTSSEHMYVNANTGLDSETFTVFAVVMTPAHTATVTYNILAGDGGTAGANRWGLQYTTDTSNAYVQFYSADYMGNWVTSAHLVSTSAEMMILTGVRMSSSSGMAVNGYGLSTNSTGYSMETLGTHAGFTIGNDTTGTGGFLGGSIGEVVVYPRELTDSEMATVECYLGKKWEIVIGRTCP